MLKIILQTLFLHIVLYVLPFHSLAQHEKEDAIFMAATYHFPYNLSEPDVRLMLPNRLIEISGLSWIASDKLACIQDEEGVIFIYNLDDKTIEREIKFGEEGDYEGLELVGDDAWILKSNGNMYKVSNWADEKKMSVKKIETDLSKKNNCEGLGMDPLGNNLLIACKGFPYLEDKSGKSKKAVYQFDLKEEKLNKKPVFIIDLDQVKYYKKYNTMTSWGVEIMSLIDESEGDVSFQPSGIAVHPLTGNIYITGAVGDLIIVLHPAGEILAMIELDPSRFRQPEGICFDPDGNLYISNEGKDSKANIMKFKYQY